MVSQFVYSNWSSHNHTKALPHISTYLISFWVCSFKGNIDSSPIPQQDLFKRHLSEMQAQTWYFRCWYCLNKNWANQLGWLSQNLRKLYIRDLLQYFCISSISTGEGLCQPTRSVIGKSMYVSCVWPQNIRISLLLYLELATIRQTESRLLVLEHSPTSLLTLRWHKVVAVCPTSSCTSRVSLNRIKTHLTFSRKILTLPKKWAWLSSPLEH